MEKKKDRGLTVALVAAVVIISLGLIILELLTNIHNISL